MENLFDMHDFVFNSIVGKDSMFNTNKPKMEHKEYPQEETMDAHDFAYGEFDAEEQYKNEYFK